MIIKPVASFELGPDARGALKECFDKYGKEILQAWSLLCPETESATLEGAALSGQRRAGYEKAIEELIVFITPTADKPVGTPVSAYPELDDDKAWEKQEQSEQKTV